MLFVLLLSSISIGAGFFSYGYFKYKTKKIQLKHEAEMEKRLSARFSVDD